MLKLTRDEAVRMAVENNPDLAADRYDPAISAGTTHRRQSRIPADAAAGVQRNSQLQPPTSLFSGDEGHEHRCLVRQRRHRPAAAVGRRQLPVRLEHVEDDDQQPDRTASIPR